MLPVTDLSLLCAIGVFIGIVAVTSGGGATAGVPMVLLLGYSATTSIAAVSFGLMASFVTGTLTYRRLGSAQGSLPTHLWPLAILGSVLGANLVLNLDPDILRRIIIGLLVVVLALSFTFRPAKSQEHRSTTSAKKRVGTVVIFLLCVYCGFFGAGFGTFLIFALMYFYGYSFLESASAGTALALVVIIASLLTYLFRGVISFDVGIPLAVGCSIGGFMGARLAHRGGDRLIRAIFFASTLLLTLKLAYDVYA